MYLSMLKHDIRKMSRDIHVIKSEFSISLIYPMVRMIPAYFFIRPILYTYSKNLFVKCYLKYSYLA
jgi:hypothetical protein